MKEFERKLSDDECNDWFKKLFGGIWQQTKLEEIIFADDTEKNNYYQTVLASDKEKSIVHSLAGFFGDSLWEVFSNNHSVYTIDSNIEFEIGSFRGSGSFISDFIKSENSELQFSYMDFYMGHFGKEKATVKSYEYIFNKLNENCFDWFYSYPQLGIVDFSKTQNDSPENYNPNTLLEDEIGKKGFLKMIDEINKEAFNKIQNSPLPAIIRAYIKVFNKYPAGWVEN